MFLAIGSKIEGSKTISEKFVGEKASANAKVMSLPTKNLYKRRLFFCFCHKIVLVL